jgi:hypothetical protein
MEGRVVGFQKWGSEIVIPDAEGDPGQGDDEVQTSGVLDVDGLSRLCAACSLAGMTN